MQMDVKRIVWLCHGYSNVNRKKIKRDDVEFSCFGIVESKSQQRNARNKASKVAGLIKRSMKRDQESSGDHKMVRIQIKKSLALLPRLLWSKKSANYWIANCQLTTSWWFNSWDLFHAARPSSCYLSHLIRPVTTMRRHDNFHQLQNISSSYEQNASKKSTRRHSKSLKIKDLVVRPVCARLRSTLERELFHICTFMK